MRTYHECIQELFSMATNKRARLGLETIQLLLQYLDYPERQFSAVHVAGTNGKGSVTAKIAAGLQLKGKRVGLYTSPHIATFRERIRVNGVMITEEEVVEGLNKIFPLLNDISATFFEITTALAFEYFRRKQVDIAVVEVGLGGRLDATNVCWPILSVITSISLDHTEILGATEEAIANEKAGIIKSHIPIIIGPRVPVDVVQQVATKHESPLLQVEGVFESFEEENRAVARVCLKHLGAFSDQALFALPPCRFEKRTVADKTIILDVAHNEDGIKKLFHRVKMEFPECFITAIYGASKEKDVAACLRAFLSEVERVVFVEADTKRKMQTEELVALVPQYYKHKCFARATIAEAVDDAFHSPGQLIVIFGTFFIMAEARRALGIIEPSDHMPIIEKVL